MINAERVTLLVQGEAIGVAFGVENWARAAQFLCAKGEANRPPHLRNHQSLSMADLAKGFTGNGDDAGGED